MFTVKLTESVILFKPKIILRAKSEGESTCRSLESTARLKD